MRTIVKSFVNFCWFFFKWGALIAFVAALAAIPYFYYRVDEELRLRVERRFAAHYPHLQVTVRSAEIVEGEGIEVRGLTIVEPGATGPRAELAHFDEIFLHCNADLAELVTGEPKVTRIVMRRPTFQVTRRPDGTWSTAQLLPLPKFSDEPPLIVVENCTVEIFDPVKNPSSTFNCRDVNLTVTASQPEPTAGKGNSPAREVLVEGFCAGDHLERVEFGGRLSPDGTRWNFSGKVAGLALSPELRKSLPSGASDQLDLLGALRSQAEVAFHVSRDPQRPRPLEFNVLARLERGRIEHPRLPYPLTDVWATVECAADRIQVKDFKARNGQSTLALRGAWEGYTTTSPFYLEANCERLLINRQLLEVAPEAWKSQWYKFFLTGVVDAGLKLRFDGQNYEPQLVCHCVDTSFTYHGFPYPLTGGRGVIKYLDDALEIDLRAQSGAEDVNIRGRVVNVRTAPGGSIEVAGDNLALDQKLFDALRDPVRQFVKSLHPQGTFNLLARFDWQPNPSGSAEPPPVRRQIVLNLNSCALRYDRFPYPIFNIRGTIDVANDRWEFRDLRGTNDYGKIGCEGHYTAAPEGGDLLLKFVGQNIELEEELRDALQPHLRQVWNDMSPRGRIQLETCDVRYRFADKQLGISARVVPIGDTVSIEPSYFPYRLEKLAGAVRFEDGRLTIERVTGRHGDTAVMMRGSCETHPDGNWRLSLDELTVDRLRFDRDLYSALPQRTSERIRRLDPQGPMHLRGRLQLAGGGDPARAQSGAWQVRCDFQQGSLRCGPRIEQVYGGLEFDGGFDQQGFRTRGELNVDSLLCRGLQFTQVRGPLWIDDQRILLGAWAERPAGKNAPRHLTANCVGGIVVADGGVSLVPSTQYQVVASLADGDLRQFAQDLSVNRQNLSGRLSAQVQLRGTSDGLRTLAGEGRVQIRDAYVYELPQMVSLLTILSFKPPDTNAFTTSDIDFHILGEHVYLDHIDFRGDAISLEGRGEMSFAQDVDLRFHAMVGRNEIHVPIISDVFRAASQEIMQIHIGGKLDSPDIRRDHFPVVNQALQNLQAGFERPRPASPLGPMRAAPPPTAQAPRGAPYPAGNASRPPTATQGNAPVR